MNEFVSISELTQSRKDKTNSKDITERFSSSVMLQIAERVCTLRSLIYRWCGIGGGRGEVVWNTRGERGGWKKCKLIVEGRGWNSREGLKKVNILTAK